MGNAHVKCTCILHRPFTLCLATQQPHGLAPLYATLHLHYTCYGCLPHTTGFATSEQGM